MSKRRKSTDKHATQVRSGFSVPSSLRLSVPAGVALIVVAVFVAYLPALNGGFVFDDDKLLTENDLIRAPDGPFRFWCTAEAADYWPISNTTLWIEWRLWGMNSIGYHVTNLILHIVESLLIWIILRKLSIPGAFLAAVIFAVHPVNVESVAWIAQRKGMLAMLFFLLSILFYIKGEIPSSSPQNGLPGCHAHACHGHVRQSIASRWYWLSLVAFLLAMLSKGSVAVLPVLLLAIIWWRRPLTTWDLLRIAPFFAVAIMLTVVNLWFQTHGAELVVRSASFTERLLGAGGVVWFYLYKALLPFDLVFFYPQWRIDTGNSLWWLPLLAAGAVTALLWWYREGWSRPFLFAWVFFCVALVPVLGFTDVGFMKYSLVADHYQHIAIIGVIALVAAGFSVWHQRMRGGAHWAVAAVAIVVVVLMFLTWRQSSLYCDKITLYEATLEKNPGCWMAHSNLGFALAQVGRRQEAIEHYKQALQFKPDFPEVHNNMGVEFDQAGRPQKAIEYYEQALALKPDYPMAHYNLGVALDHVGQPQEAIRHYEEALRLKPDYPEAHFNLGVVLANLGRRQEAIEHYEQALQIKSNYPKVHYNLGLTLAKLGRLPEAIQHYQQAVRLKHDYIEAYFNLALLYARTRQSADAISAARKAIEVSQSQGQMERAKKMENWLNSYLENSNDIPETPPQSKSTPQ